MLDRRVPDPSPPQAASLSCPSLQIKPDDVVDKPRDVGITTIAAANLIPGERNIANICTQLFLHSCPKGYRSPIQSLLLWLEELSVDACTSPSCEAVNF